MRRWRRGMSMMVVAAGVGLSGGGVAMAMNGYKWKYRPLVVFAGGAADPSLVRQRATVKSLRPAFIDRKMVVVYVTGDQVSTDLGPPPRQSAAALRQSYGIGDGQFRAVLVGLDGGVKLTSSTPLSGETLFDTIDAMPMRKEERQGR